MPFAKASPEGSLSVAKPESRLLPKTQSFLRPGQVKTSAESPVSGIGVLMVSPPLDSYKGWLLKWTNYLKGYQRRWFVLGNGLLSYYRYGSTEVGHLRLEGGDGRPRLWGVTITLLRCLHELLLVEVMSGNCQGKM